jgi:hypothetical protein
MTRQRCWRRILRRLVAAAVLVVLAAPAAARQSSLGAASAPNVPAVTGTAAISGVVTDAVSGQPVAGAIVALGRTENSPQALPRLVTDARGRFVFRNLPPAPNYTLSARRFGYAYTRYGWTAPNQSLAVDDIKRIALADDQWISTVSIPLWKLGTISGRVLDERGEPVVGGAVRGFTMRKIAGQPQPVAGPLVTTDDRGVYRMTDLEPEQYVVSVLSVQSTVPSTTPEAAQTRAIGEIETGGIGAGRPSTVATPGIEVDGRHRLVMTNFVTPPPPGDSAPRAYPPIFFPNARTFGDATAIDIRYGESRADVDFQLEPVAAVRVSGRLDGLPGPPPRFLLRLMPAGRELLGFGGEAATTVVESDGTFTFLNVPEGSYTILAQASVMDFTSGNASVRLADAPGFPGGGISVGSMPSVPGLEYLTRSGQPAPFWGRAAVTVGARDVDDVSILVHPAITVRGKIVFAEGVAAPPAGTSFVMMMQPASGDPTLGRPFTFTSDTQGFAFTVANLMSGTYLLQGSRFAIVSAMWDGHDLTDTGFDTSSGHNFDDVVVTMTDKTTEIGGVVRDKSGVASNAAVIAFPTDQSRWTNFGWSPARLKAAPASSTGVYQLKGLPEGEYFLVAVDASKIDNWLDPAFLTAAAPFATRVAVKWGDTQKVELTKADVTLK